jgi:hypothetical protein
MTIRLFRDRLSSTIRAWEDFNSNKGSLFVVESTRLFAWWQKDLSTITECISDLREKQELMAEKLDRFRSMRDGVRPSSATGEVYVPNYSCRS